MTNLREELAMRIQVVARNSILESGEIHLAIADEVIRQMEWARREGWNDCGDQFMLQPHEYFDQHNNHDVGLTLAPKDWKP